MHITREKIEVQTLFSNMKALHYKLCSNARYKFVYR